MIEHQYFYIWNLTCVIRLFLSTINIVVLADHDQNGIMGILQYTQRIKPIDPIAPSRVT